MTEQELFEKGEQIKQAIKTILEGTQIGCVLSLIDLSDDDGLCGTTTNMCSHNTLIALQSSIDYILSTQTERN